MEWPIGFILAIENFQPAGQPLQDLFAVDAVKLSLPGIVGNHITAPAGALASKDFFYMQIVAFLLGFAVDLEVRGSRLINLEIGVGGIEKDQINRQIYAYNCRTRESV